MTFQGIATLGSILDFSLAENLGSFSLQDGASEWLYYVENPIHPPTRPPRFLYSTNLASFSLQDGATKW